MPEHDHSSDSSLKVSDRRHFTNSGERRAEVAEDHGEPMPPVAPPVTSPVAPPPASPPPPPPPSSSSPKAKTEEAPKFERLASREINFSGLLEELYATALMQLGAMAQPGQAPRVDLEGARETIDLLGLLQEKTHGNRTPEEDGLLTNALYELRIGYTQVAKAANSRIAVPAPPLPRR